MYTDTTYKLPEPESTDIVPATAVRDGGGPDGAGGGNPTPAEMSRSAPEWLLLVLWRQKWLVLCVLAIAVVAGAIYTVVATPVYTATAKIYVRPIGPLTTSGPTGIANQGGTNFLYTQKELITSEPVLAIASAMPRVADTATLKGQPKPVQVLKAVLDADVDRNDIITITAFAENGKDAEAIANGARDAYMAYQTKPKGAASSMNETKKVLEEKRKETEARLKATVESLQAMEAQYGPLNQKDERTNIVLKRLQGLSDALIESQKEVIGAKTQFEDAARSLGLSNEQLLKVGPEEGDLDLPGTSEAEQGLYRSAILQAQAQLQELEQRYLPNHPYVIAQKRRLDQWRRNYLGLIRRVYVAALRKEQEFQASYNTEQKHAIEIGAHSAEYARLQDDADRLKKERDEYISAVRAIEIDSKTGGLAIDLVEDAAVPAKAALPNPKRVLPISAAVGLVLGVLLACLRELIDDRFRSAGEIKTSLGMPVLAVIPQSTTKRSPSVLGQRILLDPGSDAAEAYRSLRTALQFATSEQMRTLLVTSPQAGDGKTTLVSNLSIALAQAGKRVCLVDCDLRKPMQHEIFGAKSNTGLSMVLAGRCALDSALQRTSVSGLDILPCGPLPANPNEILNSREFTDLLEQLADRFDVVVIDSPPTDAASDSRVIAASCDATLIVLKAQTAHRRATERARDSLLGVGARIVGLVVNDLPRRTSTPYGQMTASRRYVPGLTSQEYDILQARAK